MPLITSLVATTELEAINLMLSAIGESPVAAVSVADANVEMAVNHLRDTTKETLEEGWKFNTEFGLALSPVTSAQAWTDPDGTAQTLTVFTPPTGLAKWNLSATVNQIDLDVTVRPSKTYAPIGTLVFYDRSANRDGFIAADFPKLYIDAVWFFDFEKLPDTARRYITIAAGRRLVRDLLGNSERVTQEDEMKALRALKREQGDEDVYNLLQSPDVADFFGGRLSSSGVGVDLRDAP